MGFRKAWSLVVACSGVLYFSQEEYIGPIPSESERRGDPLGSSGSSRGHEAKVECTHLRRCTARGEETEDGAQGLWGLEAEKRRVWLRGQQADAV